MDEDNRPAAEKFCAKAGICLEALLAGVNTANTVIPAKLLNNGCVAEIVLTVRPTWPQLNTWLRIWMGDRIGDDIKVDRIRSVVQKLVEKRKKLMKRNTHGPSQKELKDLLKTPFFIDPPMPKGRNLRTNEALPSVPTSGAVSTTSPLQCVTRTTMTSLLKTGQRVIPLVSCRTRLSPASLNTQTPSSTYTTSSSTYTTSSSTYTTPSSTYTTPSSTYTTPSSTYTTPSSTYTTPLSNFTKPLSLNSQSSPSTLSPPSVHKTQSTVCSSPSSSNSTQSAPRVCGRTVLELKLWKRKFEDTKRKLKNCRSRAFRLSKKVNRLKEHIKQRGNQHNTQRRLRERQLQQRHLRFKKLMKLRIPTHEKAIQTQPDGKLCETSHAENTELSNSTDMDTNSGLPQRK